MRTDPYERQLLRDAGGPEVELPENWDEESDERAAEDAADQALEERFDREAGG